MTTFSYIQRIATIAAGCAVISIAAPASAQDNVGSTSQQLLGDLGFENDCTDEFKQFNYDILFHGRTAVAAEAFRGCLNRRMRADYRSCNTDPFKDDSINVQIARLFDIAWSDNDVEIQCTGARGNASAEIDRYYNMNPERFAWADWFSNQQRKLSLPTCTAEQLAQEWPDGKPCRDSGYPWPQSQAAGIVWHEVSHQHGYDHGEAPNERAKRDCSRQSDEDWHYQVNTAPYILGQCVSEVLSNAGQICGNMRACPFANMLKLQTSDGSSSCACSFDPKGLIAMLKVSGGGLKTVHIGGGGGGWIGGWNVGRENTVHGTGSFTGPAGQILITSSWGLGILEIDENTRSSKIMVKNGVRAGGWVVDTRNNRFPGIGDLTGNGRDDIIVTSDWGLGILSASGSTLASPVMIRNGQRAGGWVIDMPRNRIQAVADFAGGRAQDILITSDWGLGILTQSGATFSSPVMVKNGTRVGGWVIDTSKQRIRGAGNLTGDGKAEIIISSDWGLGILSVSGSTLTSPVMARNGTTAGPVTINTRSGFDVLGAGDFDNDGRDDILAATGNGLAVLSIDGDQLRTIAYAANLTRIGGWVVNTDDQYFRGIADIDERGGDDILVTSSWGVGVLSVSGGQFVQRAIHRNKTIADGWYVRSEDRIISGEGMTADGGGALITFRSSRPVVRVR